MIWSTLGSEAPLGARLRASGAANGEYAEAETYADKALKSFTRGEFAEFVHVIGAPRETGCLNRTVGSV